MARNEKQATRALTEEELEKLAIEELINESRDPSGSSGLKRKRLDVAAHRMLLNSLPTRSKKSGSISERERQHVVEQDGKTSSKAEQTLYSGSKRINRPS